MNNYVNMPPTSQYWELNLGPNACWQMLSESCPALFLFVYFSKFSDKPEWVSQADCELVNFLLPAPEWLGLLVCIPRPGIIVFLNSSTITALPLRGTVLNITVECGLFGFILCFEIGSHSVVQSRLIFNLLTAILLSEPSECCDYRSELPCLVVMWS